MCYGYAIMAFISNMYDDSILVGGGCVLAPGFGRGSPHTKHRSESPLAGTKVRYTVQKVVQAEFGVPHQEAWCHI